MRVVDPELGKLERENVGHESSHISLNTPILGTTSTSTRRHTRRESNPGKTPINDLITFIIDVSTFSIQMLKKVIQ